MTLRKQLNGLQPQKNASDKSLDETRKRKAKARAALENRKHSIADGIFAGIEIQRAARAAFGRGEPAEGPAMPKQALEIFRATLPDDHPHIALTLAHLAALPEQED